MIKYIVLFLFLFCCFTLQAQNKWILHSYGYGKNTNRDALEWKYSFSNYLIETNDSLFTCRANARKKIVLV
ncbi:MAG: hypothetical protein COZ18_02410 [Flexibacter sp. CG_4_10_14_3_um_filter_32_15]|nr:MAG: hypothetical protein COZ18_02410 [Flexibacter sp. CG_4_10_14_3_um_filter_32_15]